MSVVALSPTNSASTRQPLECWPSLRRQELVAFDAQAAKLANTTWQSCRGEALAHGAGREPGDTGVDVFVKRLFMDTVGVDHIALFSEPKCVARTYIQLSSCSSGIDQLDLTDAQGGEGREGRRRQMTCDQMRGEARRGEATREK